jgi:class 3 adenylate cyclase
MDTEGYKRKLTTILSADVAGYSRLMGEDEAATVKTLTTYRGIMADLTKQHRGRVIDSPGDNVLAEFTSVVDAVQCAVAVQKEFQARNAELPENRRMEFRIGINLGDVIEEEERIYGDGVNIAARLEALADPGGICVSKTAFDHTESKLPLGYEYLGEQTVKNIAKPVGAYRVLMDPRVTVAVAKDKKSPVPLWQEKKVVTGAIAVLVVIICVAIWHFFFRPPPMEVAAVASSEKRVSSIATKNFTDTNISALKVELIEQTWNIMPAGTKVYAGGKEYSIRQDLAHADLKLRIKNTSSEKIKIPDWVLLDKNKDYLAPFRLTEDDGKGYIKERVFINGNKTKFIYLRSTSKSLRSQREKQPLFLVDKTQSFIWPLKRIPDRATLLKNRQGKIKN